MTATRKGIRVTVRKTRAPKWDTLRRLRVALANNNRGRWYVIVTQRTVGDLERCFDEGRAALLLACTVGGILGDHKVLRGEGGHYLYMQLNNLDGDVALCLEELGVDVIGGIMFSQIRFY